MMGSRNRDSCRKLFTSMEILPLPFLYIFLLLRFVIKNKDLFITNNEIRNFGTRQHHNFHHPSANLNKYQTGVFYMGIKIFTSLPAYIKKEFTNSTIPLYDILYYIITLYLYYINIMTNSISYRLIYLVRIDRMHNK